MVTIALAWLYATLLCTFFGWAVIVPRFSDRPHWSGAVPLSVLPLIGLAVVSVLTGYLSLVMPIGGWAHLVVLSVAAIVGSLNRHRIHLLWSHLAAVRSLGWMSWAAGSLLLVFLLLKSALPVDIHGALAFMFHSDTAYYHAPSIRWISEYGVVPGLGNLLSPLAVDYLWFQPDALFGFSFLLPHRLHALSGFTVFWAYCFALGGFREFLLSKDGRVFSNAFRALMLLPLLELGNYIVSDSGDEPAALLVLITLALGCRYIERHGDSSSARPLFAAVAILAFFTVALKWSALPLLLLIMGFTLRNVRSGHGMKPINVASLATAMLLPKLVRSVILSGYLLYPFPALDWFDVDWKMPRDVVVAEKRYVESMARIRFDRPGALLACDTSAWFRDWLQQFLDRPVGASLATALAALILVALLRPRRVFGMLARYRIVFLTVLSALLYWFLTAPHVRFAYGFLASAAMLTGLTAGWSLAPPGGRLLGGRLSRFATGLAVTITAALVLFSCPCPLPGDALGTGVQFSAYYIARLDRIRRGKASPDPLIHQTPYPEVPVARFDLGGLPIYRPVTGQHCWDAPLPCTPYLYRRIQARGRSLADGFRAVPGPVEAFDGRRLAEEWSSAAALRGLNARVRHPLEQSSPGDCR